jgi:hypothetical protein
MNGITRHRKKRRSTALGAFLVWACWAALSCGKGNERWNCRPLGNAERCESQVAVVPKASGWKCHEWRGSILCSMPASGASRVLSDPWSCRRDGSLWLCHRDGLGFPPVRDAARSEGVKDGASFWRCSLDGEGRRQCRPRNWGNSSWKCERDACSLALPDFPNQWEWDCYDSAGRVVCRSSTPDEADVDWICQSSERGILCVDPDPDFPEGATSGWSCRYDAERTNARICTRAETRPCASDAECSHGFCLQRRCVMASLSAECFFGRDCSVGVCTGGLCVAGSGAN